MSERVLTCVQVLLLVVDVDMNTRGGQALRVAGWSSVEWWRSAAGMRVTDDADACTHPFTFAGGCRRRSGWMD